MVRSAFILILGLILGMPLFAPAMALPQVKDIQTEAGIKAWLVEDHRLPLIHVKLHWRGGALADPQDREGLTYFMAQLLREGAGTRDAKAFRAALHKTAARVEIIANADEVEIEFSVLKSQKHAFLNLLRHALYHPRFDDAAIDDARQIILSELNANQQSTRERAFLNWRWLVFGDHPYAEDSAGTHISVKAVTRAELIAHHKKYFARDNLLVSVVGDITEAETKKMLDMLLAELPEKAQLAVPPSVQIDTKKDYIFERRAVPQSMIVFGHEGLPFKHPDFYAASLVNHILGGGGLSARLMQEIREARGLSYGIYSYFVQFRLAPLWLGSFSTKHETQDEAVRVLRDEIRRLTQHGISAAELARAKDYIIGSYPLRFSSSTSILRQLNELQVHGVAANYFQTRNQKFAAVSLEQANRVAADFFQADRLFITSIGEHEIDKAVLD